MDLLGKAAGRPFVAVSDPALGTSRLDIQDFPLSFTANCTPADCLVAGYSLVEGGGGEGRAGWGE